MTRFFLILSLVAATQAQANELDNPATVTNQDLQGTMVIRVDNRDQSASFLKTDALLGNQEQALQLSQGEFQAMSLDQRSELDQEGGSSSWYYYYANYSYGYGYYNPCLNWYGRTYNPYYSYNYGHYSYYYYGAYSYRWW